MKVHIQANGDVYAGERRSDFNLTHSNHIEVRYSRILELADARDSYNPFEVQKVVEQDHAEILKVRWYVCFNLI